jgi:hypothetical protein
MSDHSAPPADLGAAMDAVRALRRRRQRNRLADIEWFEAAYRVYVVALFGGGGVLWISALLGEASLSADATADVARHGPAVLGMLAALAVLVGLRNGAIGGPLALEAADVSYVMLAPVDRWRSLARPTWQRVRSAVAVGVLAGGIAGQLAGRRLPGSPLAWCGGGALFGATVAAIWAAAALIAHGTRLSRPLATALGGVVVAWQAAAAASTDRSVIGPLDTAGGLALWGWRQRNTEAVLPLVVLVALVVGVSMIGRTSLDALTRRSDLVAQLRFAVTMQDLRTVILLRRQLNQERPRQRPWVRARLHWVPRHVVRRGLHGLARTPLPKLVRMVALAAGIGACDAVAVQGTPSMVAPAALLAMLLGLEVTEALAQEIDHPDRTDALITERSAVLAQHLWVPAITLLPLAVVAAAAAVAVAGRDAIAPAAIVAVPALWAGACGAVVSTVRDAADAIGGERQAAFMPPEMAGMQTAIRVIWPLVVSALPSAALLLITTTSSSIGGAVRAAVGSLLVCAATVVWVRTRDRVRASVSSFMAEGRSYTQQQRSVR